MKLLQKYDSLGPKHIRYLSRLHSTRNNSLQNDIQHDDRKGYTELEEKNYLNKLRELREKESITYYEP